ncbi:hypothetical protein, partial [Actinomadura keratinilytica]|uniref:hypothetical protein n=1 Tax=Actinomadura keratinilytica TaxID=547461 RepID=UPI0031EE4423
RDRDNPVTSVIRMEKAQCTAEPATEMIISTHILPRYREVPRRHDANDISHFLHAARHIGRDSALFTAVPPNTADAEMVERRI